MAEKIEDLIAYVLQIADNSLILGHRLSEWCGHGPVLEQDIAMTNIALDLIGQSRTLYQYAAQLEGEGKTEDYYPFLRDVRNFRNVLLVEQPNGNFGDTIVRQFFFDTFNFYFLTELTKSADSHLAGYAEKSLKEVSYHLRFSSEWVIRLGDGTEESKEKIQEAINQLWPYRYECLNPSELDQKMSKDGIGPDLTALKEAFDSKIDEVIENAGLAKPTNEWNHEGGKRGIHSEQMGFILAELQYMQRAYPGLEW